MLLFLFLLLTSLVSPTGAFILPSPPRLHAAAWRGSLRGQERAVAVDRSDGQIPPDAPTSAAADIEEFQRSLLEANVVYEAAVAEAERAPARKMPAATSAIEASEKFTPELAAAERNFTTPAEYENTR